MEVEYSYAATDAILPVELSRCFHISRHFDDAIRDTGT